MNEPTNTPRPSPRNVLRPRRLALLAGAAGLGMAILVAGPGGYASLHVPAFGAAAQAAEAAQAPAGFADLVAKVKPAVISVRVKLDEIWQFWSDRRPAAPPDHYR